MAKVYFISENTVRTEGLIDENVDSKFIQSSIEQAQILCKEFIDPCIYLKLEDCITNGFKEEDEDYKTLLDDYLTFYLLYKVCEDICLPLTFKMRNAGVVQQNDTHFQQVAQMKDLTYVEAHYRNTADAWKLRAVKYIEEKGLGCNKCKKDNLQTGPIHFRK